MSPEKKPRSDSDRTTINLTPILDRILAAKSGGWEHVPLSRKAVILLEEYLGILESGRLDDLEQLVEFIKLLMGKRSTRNGLSFAEIAEIMTAAGCEVGSKEVQDFYKTVEQCKKQKSKS